MGGMVALVNARYSQASAVIAMSTPYQPVMDNPGPPLHRLPPTQIIPKRVRHYPRDHPLFHRHELNYPAYPEFPAAILGELAGLGDEMVAALPQVHVPVLLIHSKADRSVPVRCMQAIYNQLGSIQKEMLAFDGMDHALVRDPQNMKVFRAVESFIDKVSKST